jgi:hypothetical protein
MNDLELWEHILHLAIKLEGTFGDIVVKEDCMRLYGPDSRLHVDKV